MKFKHEIDKELFWQIDPRLREIVCRLESFLWQTLDYELTITSTIRIIHDKTGIHACGRAVDIRTRDLSLEMINYIVRWINKEYPYDHKRPKKVSCMYHSVGLGWHFHIQVSERK